MRNRADTLFLRAEKETFVEKPNGTQSKIEGEGSVEVEIKDCQDA